MIMTTNLLCSPFTIHANSYFPWHSPKLTSTSFIDYTKYRNLDTIRLLYPKIDVGGFHKTAKPTSHVMSQIPILQPRLILGLQTEIKGNAHFVSDEEVIYPVGGVLTLHNYYQRRQKFIKLSDKGQNVTAIAISPNRKLIAVAESGEKPLATLFDALTCKKKKQILLPPDKECAAREFAAISFSQDSKTIIVVVGEPDWVMYTYKCDKAKVESTTRANNSNGTGTVVQIACNPTDPNLLVLVGTQLFRILACSENNWRQYGFNKAEAIWFRCAAWLSQERLLAGTNDGKILTFESGELKFVHWAVDLTVLNFKVAEDEAPPQVGGSQVNIFDVEMGSMKYGEDYEIRAIFNFMKGFAFGCMIGTVHFFEKETPHKYRKRNVFKIPDHNIEREDETEQDKVIMNTVHGMSINVSEDRLLVTCKESQIYVVRLWGPDITMNPEIPLTELGMNLHHGPIGGMAVCSWKPIFLTSGAWDRSLKLWNFETETLELDKTYLEELHGLALHPTGLFAIVGFSDKLRYLTILMDEFSVTREFAIRNCKLCRFSRLGHFFAAANGNVIQIYSSITFEHMYNLKGHNGRVTGLSWMYDDYKMASCGTEGAVYEWQISTTRRISETIIKSCQFADASMTADGKSVFAVGSDGHIREIMNCNVHRDVTVCPTGLDNVVLSNSDLMLFVSGNQGTVYSVKFPILDVAEYVEYAVHSTKITHMAITYDDRLLITCSKDGVICIWKLSNIEGKAVKLDKEFTPSSEILISRGDLEEKLGVIKDLQLRMHELETEHAYQMRQMEAAHNATIKDIHEGYCSAIEELKEKNETLEAEHTQEINNINTDIAKMKAKHEEFVERLEANYNEKLIIEYDKYIELEEKMEKMRNRYDMELDELTKAKNDSETNITNEFLQKLTDKEDQLEELTEQLTQRTREHEVIKQQIEDDADREIYELKTTYEKQLTLEQDSNVKLKGETQIIKKKLMASQKEIDDLKHTVHLHEMEQMKLKQIILGLEKDIADLKKEIAERDATIQDKEKRIYELKRKNQELEKFRFILDFKINELTSQIEPRDRTIQEQMEQIADMVKELENLQKIIVSLDVQLNELREKLKAADSEIKREVNKNRVTKSYLKMIRTDIHHASGLIQDIPKLQKSVRDMYRKYNADKDFELIQLEDYEAKNEFLRQRDFLERTVRTLQIQVSKTKTTTQDKIKLVDENAGLIAETNILRKDLKQEMRQNQRMMAVLGLQKKMTAKESEKKLNEAVATRREIHNEYKQQLKDTKVVVDTLQEENQRLLEKILPDEPIHSDAKDFEDSESMLTKVKDDDNNLTVV